MSTAIKPYVWIVGLPRCGTASLCSALNLLGWQALHNPRQWDQMEGYNAAGDAFVAAHWRELAEMFSESKLILNTRPFDDWMMSQYRIPGFWTSQMLYDRYLRRKLYETDDISDAVAMNVAFDRHHEAVRSAGLGSRLMELPLPFTWGPLCEFLDVSVPTAEFPWLNKQAAPPSNYKVSSCIVSEVIPCSQRKHQ